MINGLSTTFLINKYIWKPTHALSAFVQTGESKCRIGLFQEGKSRLNRVDETHVQETAESRREHNWANQVTGTASTEEAQWRIKSKGLKFQKKNYTEGLHLRCGLVRLRGDIPCGNNKWEREDNCHLKVCTGDLRERCRSRGVWGAALNKERRWVWHRKQ